MSEIVNIADLSIVADASERRSRTLVKDFSLRVDAGETVALIGESGAGKSTIGLAALGYVRPGCRIAAGRITIAGTDLLSLQRQEVQRWRGKEVAYVAQSAAVAFNPSIRMSGQLIEAALIHRVMDKQAALARAIALCQAMELPDPAKTIRKFPQEFSGGQLQRLMTVMALMCRPHLLVLDEPTTAIDVTTQLGVLISLKRVIAQERTSCLYISHDLAIVAQMADRIAVLRDGRLVEENITRNILEKPAEPYTTQLVAAYELPPKGGTAAAHSAAHPRAPAEMILEVQRLTASHGHGHAKVIALEDVNLSISAGQCLGIIGESGSGKSTLARVIAGLHAPLSGTIIHAGIKVATLAHDRSKEQLRRMQIVFQSPDLALNPRVRVRDILGRPLEFYFGHRGEAKQQRIGQLLELVELPAELAERYPTQLSGGQMQRINLARALAAEPDLLICDEVTSALDTIVGSNILVLLASLQTRMNMASIFITHDLSKVRALADDLCVMRRGRIVEYGPTERVLSHPNDPYTRRLIASVPELRTDWLSEKAHFGSIENFSQNEAIGFPPRVLDVAGLCGPAQSAADPFV